MRTPARLLLLSAVISSALSFGCSATPECGADCAEPAPDTGRDAGEVDFGCVTAGCPSKQTCNPVTRKCEATCASGSDNECPQPGFCDQATKKCSCAPATHLCGTACASDSDVATCGDRCSPCPSPTGGTATCSNGTCGITCSASLKACGSSCATCPAHASATECSGDSCLAVTCANGYLACGGACAACPIGASQYACSGNQCVASTCSSGQHLCSGQCVSSTSTSSCGSRCSPCPQPSLHGYALCTSGQCDVVCDSGYIRCGNECTTCPSGTGITSTACSGNSCVAATCAAGYKVCGGTCALCPEGATSTSCSGTTCVASACSEPFTICSGDCCGLRSMKADGLAEGKVGVAHLTDGTPMAAWKASYYGYGLRVAEVGTSVATPESVAYSDLEGFSFKIDSAGTQHLVYANAPLNAPDTIYHSWRTVGGDWQNEIAYGPSSSAILLDVDMAVLPSGDLRVVFSDNLSEKLMYLEKNGSTWSAPMEIPSVYAAWDFHVAADSSGRTHLVAGTSSGVQYASGTAAGFTAGPALSTTYAQNTAPAIAVDSSGKVYVAWTDGGNIVLSTLSGGAWSAPTTVRAANDPYVALAFDGSDRPHILFPGCSPVGCGALYGVRLATGWSFQTLLRPSGDYFNPRYLALDVTASGRAAAIASTISDGVFVFAP